MWQLTSWTSRTGIQSNVLRFSSFNTVVRYFLWASGPIVNWGPPLLTAVNKSISDACSPSTLSPVSAKGKWREFERVDRFTVRRDAVTWKLTNSKTSRYKTKQSIPAESNKNRQSKQKIAPVDLTDSRRRRFRWKCDDGVTTGDFIKIKGYTKTNCLCLPKIIRLRIRIADSQHPFQYRGNFWLNALNCPSP